MKSLALILPAVLLTACASSGIVPTSRDTYMVSKTSGGGVFVSGATVKADLVREGADYCESKGLVIEVITAEGNNAVPFVHSSNGEVNFRCVPKT